MERLRAAGAIPIGRTNLPDFGLRVHTDSSLHGLTRNPWNPERTAGGSSGGEAAALATGMSPLGLGNDLGGSLRNPAHCCGVASIKPSTGAVPAATVIPPEDYGISFQLMAVEGVLARRVADVRAGLHRDRGPASARPAARPRGLRSTSPGERPAVAVLPEPPGGSTHPEVAAAVRRAADALADAGYDVIEAVPPLYEHALTVWRTWLFADIQVQEPILRAADGRGRAAVPRLRGRDGRARQRRRRVRGDGRAAGDRPRVVRVPARAPADRQPDLDPAAVPARLRHRDRGGRAGDDVA